MACATASRSRAAIAESDRPRLAREGLAGSAAVDPGQEIAAQVLASLGHELRAPLASLRATLELLTAAHAARDGAAEPALVARLESGIERIERLVENLSTWALADAGRLTLAPRRLAACSVAERALAAVAPMLARSGQRARLVTPSAFGPEVEADPQRLGQALFNLLSNASRHSPPNSTIELSVQRHGATVELRVTDQGPGVPVRRRAGIWARSAAGRPGRGGGLGLGLPLVRMLVELHGGSVGFDSPPGQGASFWIRLPASEAQGVTA